MSYQFDALGRLVGYDNTVSYAYDGLDRVATRGADSFSYGGLGLDPVADGSFLYSRSPGGRLVGMSDGVAARLVGHDRHGDVTHLFTGPGVVSDTQLFDPFGAPLAATGPWQVPVGFQGDWTDPASGHVWMGARWYEGGWASFLSRDTVFGELRTPISLNRFTYAFASPLRYWDPDGRYVLEGLGGPSLTTTSSTSTSTGTVSAAVYGRLAPEDRVEVAGLVATNPPPRPATSRLGETVVAQLSRDQLRAQVWEQHPELRVRKLKSGWSQSANYLAGVADQVLLDPLSGLINNCGIALWSVCDLPWVEPPQVDLAVGPVSTANPGDVGAYEAGYGTAVVVEGASVVWGAVKALPKLVGGAGRLVKGLRNFFRTSTDELAGADDLLNQARLARDQVAEQAGSRVATVTGGYDPATGRVVAGCSGPGFCAEDDALRQLVELGGDPDNVRFTEAIRPRTGLEVPVCVRCQATYLPSQFPASVRFQPGGKWDPW